MQSIQTLIKQQLDNNATKNLLFEDVAQTINVDLGFCAILEESLNTNISESLSKELITFAVEELTKKLYAINPYLSINVTQIKRLKKIYRTTWTKMIEAQDAQTTLREYHYPALAVWLADLYPEKFRQALKSAPNIGGVTYWEYSAELQIEALELDLNNILEPIIDIGCGSQANLAQRLHALGFKVYGIDRNLTFDQPYLKQINWFDYAFEPNKWGTIIANMSFTNHLNYIYLHDISKLDIYLSKYQEIIEALSKNGCFYYAPSLPFIEANLAPQKYRLKRESKVEGVLVSKISRIE
ncbi:MAG: hypothetical protein IT311_06980 [Anaerolineales bacterium]|nr:hypothetical protein [Anaerolineales bacterium]MCZ2120795.1 hypothetical protein [Anaerolineales bacterium]